MTEVIKEVFQVLLGLPHIGIQPVMQAGAAHKRPQQRNIAVVRRIAAPREQGIGGRRQRGDNQQAPQAAMRQADQQDDHDRDTRRDDHGAAPLFQEAAPRQRPLDQDAMSHNGVAYQEDHQRHRARRAQVQDQQVHGNAIRADRPYADGSCRRDSRVGMLQPVDDILDYQHAQRGCQQYHQNRRQQQPRTRQVPGQVRLLQLLFVAWIIPEGIDKGQAQSARARRLPPQEMPEGAQQSTDASNREPGRDGAEGDIAEKEQREQHRRREYAIANIIERVVIHHQLQRARVSKRRWVEQQAHQHRPSQQRPNRQQIRPAPAPLLIDERGIIQPDGKPDIRHPQRGQPDQMPQKILAHQRTLRRRRPRNQQRVNKEKQRRQPQPHHSQPRNPRLAIPVQPYRKGQPQEGHQVKDG